MKNTFLALILLTLIGCSSLQISTDYDKTADFSKYKSFNFSKGSLNLGIGDLNRKRLLNAVETNLIAKGLTKSDNPDLIIDIHIKIEEKVTASANTTGYPYGYRWGGGYSSTSINYYKYTDGTVFFNFIDNAKQEMVWQGVGTQTLDTDGNANQKDEKITHFVNTVLYYYTPQQKNK